MEKTTLPHSIWEALTKPPEMLSGPPYLRTNLDTDLLKLVAAAAMLADHIGSVFFPGIPAFRWVGSLAFPLFCYCMTVGLLYTGNIKRYLGRLAVFALVSQPFFILAFHPYDWQLEWSTMNIYFTLSVSLLAMTGVKTRKWWLFAVSVLLLMFINFDYTIIGVILMLIFYLCRNHPWLGAVLFCLYYLPALWNGDLSDPRCLSLGSLCADWSIFSVFAAPLIFLRTHSRLKINKYFFYIFYPAHLALIGLVRLALHI